MKQTHNPETTDLVGNLQAEIEYLKAVVRSAEKWQKRSWIKRTFHHWKMPKRADTPPTSINLVKTPTPMNVSLLGYTPISDTKEEDIFIVAYPKSGVTWLTHLVAGMRYGILAGKSHPDLTDVVIPDVHVSPVYKRFYTPGFYKSHHKPQPEYKNVVYLLRDGRDAIVSYWHFMKSLQQKPVDFLEMVKDENIFPCKWHQHVTQWMENPYGARMLLMRYEDLLKQPEVEMERFCNFSSIPLDKELLKLVIDNASISKLKAVEKSVGLEWGKQERFKDRNFYRRGVANSYKDEMPPEVLDAFMGDSAEVLAKYGYL